MRNRVIIITGVFYPEPVVSAGLMNDLATELSKDYDVTVLKPSPSRPMGFQMPDYSDSHFPFEVVELNSYVHPASDFKGRFKESYSMGKLSAHYIKEHYKEICFVYNAPWQLVGRHIVAKACNKYSIPFITPVQDIYPEGILSKLPNVPPLRYLVKIILKPSDKFLLKSAFKIHTISDKMVDYLSKTRGLPKSKFFVVRNWQDESAFVECARQNNKLNTDEVFTFMYLGNVGPLAGIEVLFDAFREAGLPNTRLVISGSGSAKQGLIDKSKSYDNCKIEFWDVPPGAVPATQNMADVMVLPVKKGFAMSSVPSKLPAYMFSAKPVLASVDSESDTALCIRESKAGWVAEPEDIGSIAKAMEMAYFSTKEERETMGKSGFDYAINNFSKQKNLNKLANECRYIIEQCKNR